MSCLGLVLGITVLLVVNYRREVVAFLPSRSLDPHVVGTPHYQSLHPPVGRSSLLILSLYPLHSSLNSCKTNPLCLCTRKQLMQNTYFPLKGVAKFRLSVRNWRRHTGHSRHWNDPTPPRPVVSVVTDRCKRTYSRGKSCLKSKIFI